MNVGFISLGCSKNLVVTEEVIGMFKENNFNIVNDETQADIIVINTCGFIESAKQEAIDTILEMAEYKNKRCKYLIVIGCLVERYKEDLEKLIPEVDLFIPIKEYDKMWDKIKALIKADNLDKAKLDFQNRVITTGNNYAYLKIAEGCSNNCTYCAIPYIQGKYISRKKEDIIEEAKGLAKKGIKELIVIAQDTTKYGIDIYGKPCLAGLLEELCKIDGIKWIRFLYAYPETITDELIQVVKKNDKICNYFDMPIQHISNKVLKRMNRKSDKDSINNVIKKIRKEIPDVILRTTLIVGFPGETNEDFEELYNFVQDTAFDKLGVFMYSKEDGTPAARLKEQIHYMTKKSRHKKIMSIQKEISRKNLEQKINNKYDIIIESISFDNKYYIGRTYMDVPEEDGVVFIKRKKEIPIGTFAKCKIIDVKDYDLIRRNSMKIKEILTNGIKTLNEYKREEASLEARMLLSNILNCKKEDLIIRYDQEISDNDLKKFEEGINKIAKGYPLQYLTNSKEFMKMDFFVDENVLVPRSDTEILVEEAINLIKNNKKDILELCTGSGAIAVSLAKYTKNANIIATDISKEALEIAKKNADTLLEDNNMQFIQSDMFENINNKFDMIISNPPYIKSEVIKEYNLMYEPKLALDGGEDGLKFYRIIINEGYKYLNPNGIIALEIGYDQKEEVIDIAKKQKKYKNIYCKKDLFGNDRIVIIS